MRIYSPLFLLGALGALSAAGAAAAPVDTSAWKCESCPYPKGTTGNVEVGMGGVSDDSAKFGTYTGLESRGAYLLLGGDVSHRGDDGYFADLTAANLGIDTRSLEANAGREGLYGLELGYAEIPRYFGDNAMTPFLGNGGNLELGLNIIHWLTHDDAFIAIQPKAAPDQTLALDRNAQIAISLGFLIILPLGLLIAGFTIWLRRRKR